MKRKVLIAVSILLSLLMLCACSAKQNIEDENKLAFHLSKLPDIGPYKSPDKVSYFSENGAESSFTPRSDYKEIIPYVCKSTKFIRADSDFGYNENIYGFATADGKIITGGIYGSIMTESLSDGRTVYIAAALRTNRDEENPKDLFWGSDRSCDIIASDGSWMIKCSNGFHTISDSGYICAADDDGNGKVYDFKGNLVLDAKEIFGEPFLLNLYYADSGKYVIEAYKSAAFWDYHEVQRTAPYVVCVNSEGEILYELALDGWEIENYANGRFIISNNNTYRYALCDLYGEILVTKLDRLEYDKATNSFIGYKEDPNGNQEGSLWVKYNTDGEEIASFKIPYEAAYGPELLSSDSVTAAVCPKDSYLDNDIYKLSYWIDFKNEKMIDIDFDYTEAEILYSYTDDADSYIAFKTDDACDIYSVDGTYLKTLDDVSDNEISLENGLICYRTQEGNFRFKSLTGRIDLNIPEPFEKVGEYGSYYSIYGNYIEFNTYINAEDQRIIKLFNIRENEFMKENTYLDFFKAETASGDFYCAVESERAYLLNKDLEVIISLSFNDYA